MSDNNLNGQKKLGLAGLIVNGIAYLCPASILMYYGIMNVQTGGAFPLALLIAGICMLPTAASYVKMSRKYPSGGSVFTYASETMGYKIGFLVGWILILDYLFMGIVCSLSSGIYINALCPAVPAWIGIVLTVAVVTFLCYRGITMATIFNSICVIVPIITLAFTIIWMIKVILEGGPGTTGTLLSIDAFVNPEYLNVGGLMTASAILCVLFVGFDAVTTMSDEAYNPDKNIPRAVWIICIYTVISFFLVGYLMNCAWLYEPGAINDPDTAIYEFYIYLGIDWMNFVFVPLNTLCCIGCTITSMIATTRILKNMGQHGYLPKKFFGYVHPKFNTPSRNVLLYGAASLVSILFIGNLTTLSNAASFGCLLSFAVTNVAVFIAFWIKDKIRGLKAVVGYIVLPFFAAAVNIFLWLQLDNLARIIGFSWLVIGFIVLLIGTKGFKEKPELDLDV